LLGIPFVFLFRFHDDTCNVHAYEKRIILVWGNEIMIIITQRLLVTL
jgi:hypothetical protein